MEPQTPQAQVPSGARKAVITSALHAPLLVALALAVGVLAWAYQDRLNKQYDLEIQRLKADIQELVDQQGRLFAAVRGGEVAMFDGGGFTFEYPSRFDGLSCVETGTASFGYDIEKLTRSWSTDGPSFQYDVWDAKPLPDNAAAEPFQALFMRMEPARAGSLSCFVRFATGDLTPEEKFKMLQSVQVK